MRKTKAEILSSMKKDNLIQLAQHHGINAKGLKKIELIKKLQILKLNDIKKDKERKILSEIF